MKGKILGFALALISFATVGVVQMQANATVDNTRDCDKYSIVYCGTLTMGEIKNKFNDSDHAKIYASFGIQKSEISDMKNGVVYQDGTVKVGGKVVATGAVMAARYLGGSGITGSSTAKRLSVSHMGSAQTALVKFDNNGRFMFALMKPCGNPVTGHPTKPKPQPPKPSAFCKSLTFVKLGDSTYRFYGKATKENGATIKSYTFTIKKNGSVVNTKTIPQTGVAQYYDYQTTAPGNYSVSLSVATSLGNKTDSTHCVTTFTIPEQPQPSATCKEVTVDTLTSHSVRFNGSATTTNGATVNGYEFTVYNAAGAVAKTIPVTTSALSTSVNYTQETPGTYTVKLVVKTSVGDKDGENCTKQFTIPETPVATCESASVETLSRTSFKLNASATASGGATISGYEFAIYKDSTLIETVPVSSTATSVSTLYNQTTAGSYTVKVTVKTSLGDNTNANCEAPFTVHAEQAPSVVIEKYVDNKKYERVNIGEDFPYEIKVTNTGNTDLKNAVVTDTPQAGIVLSQTQAQGTVSGNVWTYTIASLPVGQSVSFVLTASVPAFTEGMLINKVCVDTTDIPGSPDACDSANVDVPPVKKQVEVCNPKTGEIITVDEDQQANYLPADSDKCQNVKPPAPVTPEVPTALPQTGPTAILMQLVGITSLAGATAYYVASRRNG